MATAAELSGAALTGATGATAATALAGPDSISMVPTLLGKSSEQKSHEFLYWEFHEGGFKQAALYQGRWKGIRKGGVESPIVLYDQSTDIAETRNVAELHADITEKISDYFKTARSESADWTPIW
jgi:arylsulfatase A-like enzyme